MLHPFFQLTIPPGKVALHWFGQASFALKDSAGTIIQVDPYFPLHRPKDKFIHPEAPLDETTLPSHFILVTHDHGDHNCLESQQRFLAANQGIRFFVTRESQARMLTGRIPDSLITVVSGGDSFQLGTMRGHAVFSKPPVGCPERAIPPPDIEHLSFIVQSADATVFFSGDPINCLSEHKELIDAVSSYQPDIAILSTHPNEGEFPDFHGTVRVARQLGCRIVIPSHYQCFVQRTYDPSELASFFNRPSDPRPLIIPYNQHVILTLEGAFVRE
jgi:L-ascorbate metabolism protein UlaG (beta-lactamase superfamily)